MFLILLIIFPVIAYYLFNRYKDNVIELNWIIKIIWSLWLCLFIIYTNNNFLRTKDLYLIIILIWYFIVFLNFFITYINIERSNLDKLKFYKTNYKERFLKILYIFMLFIFFINIKSDYEFKSYINEQNWIFKILLETSISLVLFWLLFEIIDTIKNNIFKKVILNKIYEETFKQELKKEILAELKNSNN